MRIYTHSHTDNIGCFLLLTVVPLARSAEGGAASAVVARRIVIKLVVYMVFLEGLNVKYK